MRVKDLLMQSKWRVFNVDIAKAIGLNETLVLMELADAEKYFDSDDTFYITYQQIADNTTLSEYQVRIAVKSLKAKKIVETEMKGLPAKQHYKLFIDRVADSPTLDPIKVGGSIPLNNGGSNTLKVEGSIYKEPINKKTNNKENRIIEFPFTSKNFYETWEQWKEYKKAEHRFNYKSAITEQAALMTLVKLSDSTEQDCIQIIMHTIGNGWKGFVKQNTKTNNNGTDHAQQTANSVERLINKYRAEAEQEIGNA